MPRQPEDYTPVNFGMSHAPGRFGPDAGAQIINGYVEEQTDPGADAEKHPYKHFARPGYDALATLTGSGYRGSLRLGAHVYVSSGFQVDKFDVAGTVTNIGTFVGTAPTDMARNRKSPDAQIALVSDGERAIISADSIATIADTDLPPPVSVAGIGGYFVFAIADGRYFWTSIDEGTQISALDFREAQANPDGLIAVRARLQEIMLFGPDSVEFHQLTGSSSVFERVQQVTLSMGALSRGAIKDVNGVWIFPASDNTVRMLQGYEPIRISNHDIERAISEVSDRSSLTAFVISHQGHNFYCLSSQADWTYVCDLTTQKWFKWNSYGANRWNIAGAQRMEDNRIALFSYDTDAAYVLNSLATSDAGTDFVWKLVSEAVGVFPGREIVDELFLELLPATGLETGDDWDTDPRAILRTSTDDGSTWTSEMYQKTGKFGQYDREVTFRQLGITGNKGMRFELSMSSQTNRALVRAMCRRTPLIP